MLILFKLTTKPLHISPKFMAIHPLFTSKHSVT
jgi:hypothetical protein